jgi:short-subunit dehydrogenase
MNVNLKKLRDQVIVITGATSGIGLATARRAAKKGACVVLAGRSEGALAHITDQINSDHGEAFAVTADVSREEDVARIAESAQRRFGGFDTWVNNAGTGMYGRSLDVPIDDQRQLFDTNFWGVVYGSRIAANHLRRRGGAIINLGSLVSDVAIPMLGAYSASKAAVKSFTDALRMELEKEEAPVSITLIQPGSIDTPFAEHSRNYMDAQPRLPPPVYSPEIVAKTILHAARHPMRDVIVGGGAKMMAMMNKYVPRLTDHYLENNVIEQQKRQVAIGGRKDILATPSEDPRERGRHDGKVFERSFYTATARNPMATAALAIGAGLAMAALFGSQGARADRTG